MMLSFTTLIQEYAAYAGFTLAWVVHFRTALSYLQTSRIVRRQEAEVSAPNAGKPQTAVSVVIATHNQADALQRNLPLILEQDYDNFEVIVVNNSSTDRTEDVLKTLELQYPNLRHTFTPAGARHISHKRLSLTIGIKAATHEWIVITEPDSHPCSRHWLSVMASHFHDNKKMVLGYANYMEKATRLSRKAVFLYLYHQMQFLPWAMRHKAYRCHPANLAYRKSFFMEHKGFAKDINLVDGAAELLVNRHSTATNTAVSLHPDSKVVCEGPQSAEQWRLSRTCYIETRRHFVGTWLYRLAFNLKQSANILFYCTAFIAAAWSILQQQWVGTAMVAMLFVLLCLLKINWFNRSARALRERPYHLSMLWYEARLAWWHVCSWCSYKTAPHSRFRRKAF